MTAEEELQALKRAIRDYATSKTYEDGCKNWTRVATLAGIKK